MNGYFYTVTYSFDSDRRAVGSFRTWDETWAAMLKDAKNEERIDRKENGWNTILCANKEAGKIILTNSFTDRNDVTTWLLFNNMEV